jgi:acetolactate synthase-1/2/3 large subunit
MPLRPERLLKGLSRVIPENAIFATDVGVHHNWVVQLWKARRARHLLQSWGFASMGFATCGILGAKLAQPDAEIIAIVGDGCYLFGVPSSAYWVASTYKTPHLTVIYNNGGCKGCHGVGQTSLGTDFSLLAPLFFPRGHKLPFASVIIVGYRTASSALPPALTLLWVDLR